MYMLTTLMNKTTCPSVCPWRKKVKNTADNRGDLWWRGVLKMDIKRKFTPLKFTFFHNKNILIV